MGSTWSAASSEGPAISTGIRTECLSPETRPAFSPGSKGDSTFATSGRAETSSTTDCTTAWNSGEDAVSSSF